MEIPFEKLEYNNAWGQYADIEESAVHVTKVIIKKNINQIKKEEHIQPYFVSNKLTKLQCCVVALFLYLTCHVILII